MVTALAKLLAIISNPDASFDERMAAAGALAKLGDPRLEDDNRVPILAGELGPAKGYREGTVRIAAFSMDRYPVTVAAYALFIEAGGYEDASLWTAEGWLWREEEDISAPRFWGEEEWAAYLVPSHPVVGVSAYEAEAYAASCGARLPTEAEWEWACRGTCGNCYPWGQEWLEDACGQRGFGPRGTVPVGVFPKGVSAFGIHDMVGSVWQWCSDVVISDSDEAQQITRGGGWNNLAWSIGCNSRNAYPQKARFSNLGFRCVV